MRCFLDDILVPLLQKEALSAIELCNLFFSLLSVPYKDSLWLLREQRLNAFQLFRDVIIFELLLSQFTLVPKFPVVDCPQRMVIIVVHECF